MAWWCTMSSSSAKGKKKFSNHYTESCESYKDREIFADIRQPVVVGLPSCWAKLQQIHIGRINTWSILPGESTAESRHHGLLTEYHFRALHP